MVRTHRSVAEQSEKTFASVFPEEVSTSTVSGWMAVLYSGSESNVFPRAELVRSYICSCLIFRLLNDCGCFYTTIISVFNRSINCYTIELLLMKPTLPCRLTPDCLEVGQMRLFLDFIPTRPRCQVDSMRKGSVFTRIMDLNSFEVSS